MSTTTALVLSSGGVRGIAHIGAMQRLIDEGIEFDYVVGASVGSVLAALYAATGAEPADLLAYCKALHPRMAFWHALAGRDLGWISEYAQQREGPVEEVFDRLRRGSFEHLRPGLRGLGVVVYDARHRRELVVATGSRLAEHVDLSDAVRASCSVPFLFRGVRKELDRPALLKDGGRINYLPVSVAAAPPFSADRILAVDVAFDRRRRYPTVLPTGTGTTELPDHSGWYARTRFGSSEVFALRPDVTRYGYFLIDERRIDEIYERGYSCLPDHWIESLRRDRDARTA